jgi:hypothetical protein
MFERKQRDSGALIAWFTRDVVELCGLARCEADTDAVLNGRYTVIAFMKDRVCISYRPIPGTSSIERLVPFSTCTFGASKLQNSFWIVEVFAPNERAAVSGCESLEHDGLQLLKYLSK